MDKIENGRIKLSQLFLLFIFLYLTVYYCWIIFYNGDLYFKTIISDSLSAFGSGIATVCLFYVAKRVENDEHFFWLFLLFSQSVYFLSDLIWVVYYESYLKISPFPSVCDALYIVQLICALISILYLTYLKREAAVSLRLLINILITMTVTLTIIWNYLLEPGIKLNHISIFSEIVSVSYPIFDLGLFFGILSLNSISRVFDLKVFRTMALGLCIFTLSDIVYLYLATMKAYHSGSLIDPMWIVGLLVIALSGLYKTEMLDQPQKIVRAPEKRIKLSNEYFEAVVSYLSLIVLMGLIIISKGAAVLMIGIIIVVILLLLKQNLTFFENQKLLSLLIKANHELEMNKIVLEEKNEKLSSLSTVMEKEAKTDYLTGLYNRRYADSILEVLVKQAYSNNNNLSLLVIDVDHFKLINDEFGHKVGDLALQDVSNVILENVRSNTIFARFGGEEFIGILTNTSLKEAMIIAERIRKHIENHTTTIRNLKIKVTVSIGVAELRKEQLEDMQALFKRADNSMYAAKNKGRNCIEAL